MYFFFSLVNCVLSQWSSCSKTCGPGTQTRTIKIKAKYGGTQCSSQLSKSCHLRSCPGQSIFFIKRKRVKHISLHSVNCVMSTWSSCSKTCGWGTQTRKVQIQAKYGGTQCSSQLSKSCHLRSCPGQSILVYKMKKSIAHSLSFSQLCYVNMVQLQQDVRMGNPNKKSTNPSQIWRHAMLKPTF